MNELTPRMKNWLEKMGAHIGTANKKGFPTVLVVEKAKVEGNHVVLFQLTPAQIAQIRVNIEENPYVALGPGGLACIRAPYQYKGSARLKGSVLEVEVAEIYCTKPGPEAAARLDIMPLEDMVKFDETRWRDVGPPQ
jgi:predicted pyridoxine 5'-phosphate oxidase superfamily flavin-nucleotide-binding protein